MVILLHNY